MHAEIDLLSHLGASGYLRTAAFMGADETFSTVGASWDTADLCFES
jgi:hypothetical protein